MGLFSSSNPRLDVSKVETLIGADASVQGVLTPKGSLRVDGRVEGSIADAQTVVVAEGGSVHGDISAEAVVVGGKVIGNITASEVLEILGKGHVRGDVRAPRLSVEEGGVLNGRCTMEADETESEPLETVEQS